LTPQPNISDDVCTVGVALTVPDPWGEQLQEQRAGFGDGFAWTIPTHVTMLPPTHVPVARLPNVDAHLSAVAAAYSPFDISLEGTGTFRPVTQTSFLAVSNGQGDCERLAEMVRSGPLRRRLPYPYHPHVTMAVDLSDEVHDRVENEFADYQLTFRVEDLVRFELAEHGVWEAVATFPLRDGRQTKT
jgi:2'-5' RNA ligase